MSEAFSGVMKAAELTRMTLSSLSSSVPLVIALTVGSSFVALGPADLMPSYINDLRGAFFVAAISLSTLWLAQIWFAHRPNRIKAYFLKRIGADEVRILRDYLLQNRSSRILGPTDGAVLSLVLKGILRFPLNSFSATGAPVMLEPYAIGYLRSHPHLLGLTSSDVGSEPLDDGGPEPWDYIKVPRE